MSEPDLPHRLSTRRLHWSIPASAAVILIAAFAAIGRRGLWEPDEGRYVAVAMQMLRSQDWLHPALHPEKPHLTKPPMVYWCIASSIAAFGASEWACRLFGALAFAGTASIAGLLARRLAPRRELAAALIYATSAMPFFASNIVTTDTLLTFWEAVATLGFVLAVDRAWNSRRHLLSSAPPPGDESIHFRFDGLLLMWLGFGFAFFTKGPPGLLPLIPMCLIVALITKPRRVVGLFHPVPVSMFLLIAGWWFALLAVKDAALFRYFVGDEIVARIFTAQHGRKPQWYMAFMYLPLLAGGMLPWSLGWMGEGARRRIRTFWRRCSRDPALLFLVLWLCVPLIVFMLARSRLPLYILPLMLPLTLLTARLQPVGWARSTRTWAGLAMCLGVLLGVRVILALASSHRDARGIARNLHVPRSATEIIFVDARPQYGLSFYTGLPVEQASVDGREGKERLDHELDAERGELFLVVETSELGQIEEVIQSKGWRVVDECLTGKGTTAIRVIPPAPRLARQG